MKLHQKKQEGPDFKGEVWTLDRGDMPEVRKLIKPGDNGTIAYDTETTGVNHTHADRPFAWSFANEDDQIAYVEFPVNPFTREVEYGRRPNMYASLQETLGQPCAKVGWNMKFDHQMSEAAGIRVEGEIHDAMFAAHCCRSNEINLKLKRIAGALGFVDNADEKDLKDVVNRIRTWTKRNLGWNIAEVFKRNAIGVVDRKAHTAADYWIAAELLNRHPDSAYTARLLKEGVDLKGVCSRYAILDAWRTMGCHMFYDRLMEELDVRETYEREMRLWWTTLRMERRGVRISMTEVYKQQHRSSASAKQLLRRLKAEAGDPEFNPKSPVQLAKVLYDDLGLECRTYTKTGERSTDKNALYPHRAHPFVRLLTAYKSAMTSHGTFFSNYVRKAVPVNDGQYYELSPDFNQVGPVTGRYSCRNPNLQNVANAETSRSEEPVHARSPFGPRAGFTWWHLDYSQLELRLFADLCQDPGLLHAITQDDVHSWCTNKVWGGEQESSIRQAAHALELVRDKPTSDLVAAAWEAIGWGRKGRTEEAACLDWLRSFNGDIVAAEASLKKKTTRGMSKMFIFLKIYGGGVGAASKLIKCDREVAQTYMNDYDTAFPRMVEYSEELIAKATAEGGVRTRFNRWIPVDLNYEYKAVNYKTQGSAADLVKHAMISCDDELQRLKVPMFLVLTIHDEIVFEAANTFRHEPVVYRMKQLMEDHGGRFNVKLNADVERVTQRWDRKQTVELSARDRRHAERLKKHSQAWRTSGSSSSTKRSGSLPRTSRRSSGRSRVAGGGGQR